VLGGGRYAIVDAALYNYLRRWKWFAKQSGCTWYAVRRVYSKNSTFLVRMHRQLTHCPANKVVHHINGNSLDNRLENLLCLYKWQHAFYH
jgi:hypothetical protein